MVLRHAERGEIVEVVLDLGAVGDREAERAEQRLDTFERPRDRMQVAAPGAAAGQRPVEGFGRERSFELRGGERIASRDERRLELLLRLVDRGACGGTFRRR